VDHVGGGGEEGAVAGLGGGDPEGDGEVGCADAGRAEQQDVAALLDEAKGRELGDERPVEVGLEVEVEPGQRSRARWRRARVAATRISNRRSSTRVGEARSARPRSSSAARCSAAAISSR
jgi:hypothetical protein